MNLLDRDIERQNVRIVADENTLAFHGTLREADIHVWLNALVDRVHERAVGSKLAEVVVDLRALEYANAATWRCFIHWLKKLDAETRQSYTLRMRGDAARPWQGVGIRALVPFSRRRLVVEL